MPRAHLPGAKAIFAIDPGVTIGVAAVFHALSSYRGLTFDTNDPLYVMGVIDRTEKAWGPVLVGVEQFGGAGWRTKDAALTLEQVGYFTYGNLERGRETRRLHHQARLAYEPEAREMLEKSGGRLSSHVVAALAHALAMSHNR